jgi:formylglycine-generating enzyme required for sulfatase activity
MSHENMTGGTDVGRRLLRWVSVWTLGAIVWAFAAQAQAAGAVIPNRLGMRLVYIAPGSFKMGSPPTEKGRNPDEAPHTVTLTRGFYLGQTEVTRAQWRQLMGSDPAGNDGCGPDCPVTQVTWEECLTFIGRLNVLEKTDRYRLPSEAEWEYACRAGAQTAFSAGDISALHCETDPVLDAIGWYCANSGFLPQPVAQKAPNAWGLYDMHGNVQEWCQDRAAWRHSISGRTGVFTDTYRSGAVDPLSLAGDRRVLRGGAWNSSAQDCRAAKRIVFKPVLRRTYIGFRLARSR